MEKTSVKTASAKLLVRLGVSADFLTVSGLLLSIAAGFFIYQESFFTAGVILLFSGLFDLLDGAVARASGSQSKFGGILDSSLDRYGDAAVLTGAAAYYSALGDQMVLILALVALTGSFAVSYVRARAECEIEDCRVGFWERGERLVVVALALLVNNLGAAILLLALGTHWTVFQRLALANIRTENPPKKKVPFYLHASARSSWQYSTKVFLIALILLFVRA